MLKLMKYEFRKNRTALLVIGSGLLLLQLYYMFGCFTESDTHLGGQRRAADPLVGSLLFYCVYSGCPPIIPGS